MNTKLVAAALLSATTIAFPAFAEGEGEATTTTTTTATATAAAPAEGGEKGGEKEFGNPGVIGIGGAVNFGSFGSMGETRAPTGLELALGSSKPPGGGESTTSTRFSISPTFDYFVAEGISVGAQIGFALASEKEGDKKSSSTIFGIGPRVGYNLWLTPEKLSLYPQVTFSYVNVSTKVGDNDGPSANKMNVRLFVPLLIHPAKHFHFGIGPFFAIDVASKVKAPPSSDSVDGSKDTVFGISGEIAGWL